MRKIINIAEKICMYFIIYATLFFLQITSFWGLGVSIEEAQSIWLSEDARYIMIVFGIMGLFMWIHYRRRSRKVDDNIKAIMESIGFMVAPILWIKPFFLYQLFAPSFYDLSIGLVSQYIIQLFFMFAPIMYFLIWIMKAISLHKRRLKGHVNRFSHIYLGAHH